MHTKLKKICCFSCMIAFGIVFSGCGDKNEDTPQTEVVKAFKIEKEQKKDDLVIGGKPEKKDSTVQEAESKNNDKQAGVLPSGTEQQPAGGEDMPVVDVTAPEGKVEQSGEQPSDSGQLPAGVEELPVVKKELPVVDVAAPEDGEDQLSTYNPEGRINPFAPLFKPTTETVVKAKDKPQSAREARLGRLTALEKLDLSQLKLTGIMYLPTANRSMAMVEETTGKGHVIKKGTYIGVNSGRVIEIKQNVVTIEEEVENYMGDIVVRKRELKLQKPLGEG